MTETTTQRLMWQSAPYPELLDVLVPEITYKDWVLNLHTYERETGGEGLTLRIRFPAADTREPDGPVIFWIHDFEVPCRSLNASHWMEWIFGCVMAAEKHEAMERFKVGGDTVFFPAHDMEQDMYAVRHTVQRRSIG